MLQNINEELLRITELMGFSQLNEGLIDDNNEMLAKEFDSKYGTNISKEYDFPFRYTANQVWKMFADNYNHKENEEEWVRLVNNIDKHFPYADLTDMPFDIKEKIALGMASTFNPDDIIWFAVKGIKGFMNPIKDEVSAFEKKHDIIIPWVLSPKTFEKIKKHFDGE